ncbi:MAG: hypothetical protein ACRCSN_01675 [Dermatophilaceae bacterium]
MTRRAGRGWRAGSAAGAAAVALGVILAPVATIAAWVLFLTRVDGWVRLIWFGLGALFFWQLRPRPSRRSTRAVTIGPADAPEVHRLVAEVAAVSDTAPPARVVVDTTYSIGMTPTGYLGHATLVIGLPQWTALDPRERCAALVHELVCVDVRRRLVGRLVRVAEELLESLRTLLVPTKAVTPDTVAVHQTTSMMGTHGTGDDLAGNLRRRQASAAVGAAGMTIVSVPVRLVQAALARRWQPVLHEAALVADARAAAIAGREATVGWMLSTVGVPRGLSAATNAAREPGGDPFAALASAHRPDRAELNRRVLVEEPGTRDLAHPPTVERLRVLDDDDAATGRRLDLAIVDAADRELDSWRSRLVGQLAEELVYGRP